MGTVIKGKVLIPYMGKERTYRVYLPSDYNSCNKRYPVVYMHDAQAVFDKNLSLSKTSWGVKETLEKLEHNNSFGVIVAALDNAQENRGNEYLPWKNTHSIREFMHGEIGGLGDKYADFFANDFKALIDMNYRTIPQMEATSICGSSMGGIISAYISAKYHNVYSTVGVFSIASWLAEQEFLQYINSCSGLEKQRFFIHAGTNETSDISNPQMPQIYINSSINYLWALLKLGVEAKNIVFGVGHNEEHSEIVWAKYMEQFFEFCLGK